MTMSGLRSQLAAGIRLPTAVPERQVAALVRAGHLALIAGEAAVEVLGRRRLAPGSRGALAPAIAASTRRAIVTHLRTVTGRRLGLRASITRLLARWTIGATILIVGISARSTRVARGLGALRAVLVVGVKLLMVVGVTILAPAALERATVDHVAVKLADGHRRVLMAVHLNERETAVGLHAALDDVAEVLEQGHQIVLGRVGGQIANVAGSLPGWSLVDNHVIAMDAVRGKVMMAIWRGRSHPHLLHGLLLMDRGLTLLVCPVATNGAGAKPLAIHGAQGLFSISTLAESNKPVATGTASLHIPHDSSLRDRTESRESLPENLVVDLVGKIANKDMEVV